MSRKVTDEARAARAAREKADRDAHIKRIVDDAPPLSEEQIVLLRSIMFPARESSARSKPSAYELEQRRLARERSDALAAAKKLAESLTECDACGLQPAAHFYQKGYAGFHDWEPGRADKILEGKVST